ncbi:hypothetical protein [Candidatus Pantoea formicae]
MKNRIPVNTRKPPEKQERSICERCNERYCGNCSWADGKKMAW